MVSLMKTKDPVVQEGNPILRQKAKAVLKKEIGSDRVNGIIRLMLNRLKEEKHGVAMAAPQMGESLRIFVVSPKVFLDEEAAKEEVVEKNTGQPKHIVYINPIITRQSRKKKEMPEGCLSVRGMYGSVMRHEKVSIAALDEHGTPFTYNASGLLAHIFQHEVDHLDGILYIDKAVTLGESNDDSDE